MLLWGTMDWYLPCAESLPKLEVDECGTSARARVFAEISLSSLGRERRKGGTAGVNPKQRDNFDKDKLRFNMLNNLSRTLLDLSSAERQIKYKAAVPFVHVPRELHAQWDDYGRMLREVALFRDSFSGAHRKAMIRFDKVMEAAWRKGSPHGGLDVPERLEDPAWKRVMTEAAVLLRVLADLIPECIRDA